jgi:hypothetical protein
VFRALYKDYRLFSFDENYIVVPAGTLVLTGESLGVIAQQIAELGNPAELTNHFLREDALPQRQK